MTRSFYQFILWMHPPAFRRRFGDEMLSIFDEGEKGKDILLDGLFSFARQWMLRTDSWKILVAISGGFLQVWGFGYRFGYRISSDQNWAADRQAFSPYMQEMMLITAATSCCLIVTIMLLAVWTARFQRRRLARSAPRCSKFAG